MPPYVNISTIISLFWSNKIFEQKAVMTRIFVPWCQSSCSLPTGLSGLGLPLFLFFIGKELPNYSHWKWKSLIHICNSMDCSLPGSSVHGILQVRILQQVVIPFFKGSSQPRDRTCVFCASVGGLFITEPPGEPTLSALYIQTPLTPVCRWECWGAEILGNLPKVTR